MAVGRVDAISTLDEVPGRPDVLLDAEARSVPLVDPPQVFAAARALVSDAAQATVAGLPLRGPDADPDGRVA